MTEVLAAAAVLLAWFVFRLERDGRRREAIDSAYSALRAVHHAMVEGGTAGQARGWGQIYFERDFTPAQAMKRAQETRKAVRDCLLDEVFVVPTEPLARLATAAPQEGLIEYTTVAVANHALWRLHTFNQLAGQLADFYTAHIVEITSKGTDKARREELALAAYVLSIMLHYDGIGWAWSAFPDGGRGWYGELVQTLDGNMNNLDARRRLTLRQRLWEWPYVGVDALVLIGFAAVVVRSVW